MRINFAELNHAEEQQTGKQLNIQNKLLNLWKQEEPQFQLDLHSTDTHQINFSVSQPYRFQRSISPETLKQELRYLQSQNIVPTSTINFIKDEIHKAMKIQENNKRQKPAESPEKMSHSMYFHKSNEPSKSKSKPKKTKNQQNESPFQRKNYKVDVPIAERTKKRAQQKQQKLKHQQHERLLLQRQEQLKQLTLKPMLNYTMNSKYTKKVEQKRKNHFKSENISIFDQLYSDAQRYNSKRQLQRIKASETQRIKPSRKKENIAIYSTFEERLQRSLQYSAQRKSNAQNKLDYDPATGKRMFVPDTQLSKSTYFTHFKSTSRIANCQAQKGQARPEHYAKQSVKLNSSQESIPVSLNQSQRQISRMSRKCQGRTELVSTIPGKRQEKLAQIYADLIWEHGTLNQESLSIAEERALLPFLEGLVEYEYSYEVSREVFVTLFKDYIGRLNLFDKGILFQRLKKAYPSQQSSRTDLLSSSLELPKHRTSVIAPDHHHKFNYV